MALSLANHPGCESLRASSRYPKFSQPQAGITLGRDAPGAIKAIREKLGFGTLSELGMLPEEGASCYYCQAAGRPAAPAVSLCKAKATRGISEGVPNGEWSELHFSSAEDLAKFFSLLNGEGVQLACGTVQHTASGLPRCAGKLLKFRVLLEFCQRHRKVAAAAPGPALARFTMAYTKGAWWGDANQWRAMHALLHPGVAVPDWEQ